MTNASRNARCSSRLSLVGAVLAGAHAGLGRGVAGRPGGERVHALDHHGELAAQQPDHVGRLRAGTTSSHDLRGEHAAASAAVTGSVTSQPSAIARTTAQCT